MKWLTSRSEIKAYQECPRQRYLWIHAADGGLQRRRKSLPLVFGGAFHEGIAALISGQDVEDSVATAERFLRADFEARMVDITNVSADVAGEADYFVAEQLALSEALIRGFHASQYAEFASLYEVLEVEREGCVELGNGIYLQFRPDALLRDRYSDEHYVLSWKTNSTFDSAAARADAMDMQSMSEVYGVEKQSGIEVAGVVYRHIVKGQRRRDYGSGMYRQNSPLIYGYARGREWSLDYRAGWEKRPVWRDYPAGVRGWIQSIASGQVLRKDKAEGEALEQFFPRHNPVARSREAIEQWRLQTVLQEERIQGGLRSVECNPQSKAMDAVFPLYGHSCDSYGGCQFIPICHGGVEPAVGELYMHRKANHPNAEGIEGNEENA